MKMRAAAESRLRIIKGGLSIIREKGAHFTMDDLAKEISMSKKTMYMVFSDKEEVLLAMVDFVFDEIEKEEEKALKDEGLPTVERFRRVLGAMPPAYSGFDFSGILGNATRYPGVIKRMNERLESGWELTFSVLRKGIDEGVFRPVDFTVFKLIYSAALERFLNSEELKKNKINYMEAFSSLVDLLIDGLSVRK